MQKHLISESFPWNDRTWKNLTSNNPTQNSTERHVDSALFLGKTGLGKTHLAVQFAMNLLKDDDVFLSANHPDLHVLMPEDEALEALESDQKESIATSAQKLLAQYSYRYLEQNKNKAKKIISVAQIRQLIEQVVQHPHKASHKVVIIKSADKMNSNSANALLKTLEEPPKNTIFVLIANQAERLPITIRSRCTGFHFRSPDKEIGLQWLERKGLSQHAESYLMMANRAPLKALHLSEKNEIENLREVFSSINNLWRQKISAIDLAKQWQGYDFKDISNHLSRFLIDLVRLKSIDDEQCDFVELFYPVQRDWSVKIARSVDMALLCHVFDKVSSMKKLSDSPVDKLLLLEDAAISFQKLAA
jgi:DNA polymerase-3 subunit delta'